MALGTQDLHAALRVLHRIAERCSDVTGLADAAVADLPALAAAERTTLCLCDLESGHRDVLGGPRGLIPPRHVEILDRRLHFQPWVRHRVRTRPVADPVPGAAFRNGALDDSRTGALTPREREVLRWVAAGKTNRDIADIIGASPRTVAKHLEHTYAKLGVETRTAAAMKLFG